MSEITSFSGEYRFLSNFWPSVVTDEEYRYPTVEHAYQAAKTTSASHRRDIAWAPTAGVAKRLGRRVPIRPDWEDVKIDVMRGLLRQKFAEPTLRAKLLATGTALLVEGNTWGDRFWGQCPVGVGENWLGRLLMEIRSQS